MPENDVTLFRWTLAQFAEGLFAVPFKWVDVNVVVEHLNAA